MEVRLNATRAIVVGYDSQHVPRPITAYDLEHWPFAPHEAYLQLNSRSDADDLDYAPLSEYLVGYEAGLAESRYRISVTHEFSGPLGPNIHVILIFGCQELATFSDGRPLPLERWSEQYAAWWRRWQEHWQNGDAQGGFAARIPAGVPPPARPSRAEPAADWAPTDAPAALLAPLIDFFEGRRQGDWLRVARAWPNLDVSPEERADALSTGHWPAQSPCQVTDWWIEGRQAAVWVRTTTSVSSFMLRLRPQGWTIRHVSG